jgi:pseudaminic acid cytidylyltransferase
MRIAIIPARGGSKRIPGKNIKLFFDKPIIAYSIIAALKSQLFDRVLVSTDDKEIARIAQDYGAEVPFIRDDELSGDHTGVLDVVSSAVKWAINENWNVTKVCCIYATAPFININDIRRGYESIELGKWSYTVSATEYSFPISRSFTCLPDGGMKMLYPENYSKRSQDLPTVFHDAAHFFWSDSSTLIENNLIVFDNHSCPIIIPNWRVCDIDTDDDWKRAELIWKALYL